MSDSSAVRSEASFHKPRIAKSDLETLVRKIQYDLDSTRIKLTELRAHIAALDLPTPEKPVNEEKLTRFALRTCHEYTERSLRDELALKGADPGMVERILTKCAG